MGEEGAEVARGNGGEDAPVLDGVEVIGDLVDGGVGCFSEVGGVHGG